MVAAYSPHQMADMFRDLIRHVEEAAELSPDDPSLIELRRIVLQRIAVLEKDGQEETQAHTRVPNHLTLW